MSDAPSSSAGPLPEWAVRQNYGGLFDSGVWFKHFAASALAPGVRTHIVQTDSMPEADRLVLPMIASTSTALPHCRLLDSMTNYYSCDFGPIAAAPAKPAALLELADSLAATGRNFDGVRIGPLDVQSAFASACGARLHQK